MLIEINILPAKIKCGKNHVTSISPDVEFPDIPKHFRCSECDAGVEIIAGRELVLRKIGAK